MTDYIDARAINTKYTQLPCKKCGTNVFIRKWQANPENAICNDCGEDVIRTKVEWLDIEGITPHRCGSCTLDAMAEQ